MIRWFFALYFGSAVVMGLLLAVWVWTQHPVCKDAIVSHLHGGISKREVLRACNMVSSGNVWWIKLVKA